MSTAFTAALPLLEELKENLNRLKTATDEIEKAKQSAGEHQQAAGQLQRAADEAVRAAKQAAVSQEKLVDQLGQQHQKSLGEQELLLREHVENLSLQAGEQIGRQLDGVKQSATKVQELIDRLLTEQPANLDAIGRQHEQGMEKQQEILRNGVQNWADKLHEQLQVELKLLRQSTEVLQKNTQQQHDELSAVASQLQVVAGRVTAFAEVMNAAKFTARLESIEQHQKDTLADLAKSKKASDEEATRLTELYEQQGTEFLAELQRGQQQAADTAGLHKEAYEQRMDGLQGLVEQLSGQLAQAGRQQRLWQLVTLGAVVVAGVLLFFTCHN
ncbi:hypothetical protein ACFQ48_16745 [Hymenobacter caeli]|uniref:5'-3' exonuclease n=1 Tax=Hymenobacter caeli TaxID=2735894 RepID=A0ABX2FSL5_9BACT|nr:hypothetical protein [Hymenobacter caeli]NRT19354.1 5'-3' exonuclease [Hymenobacter caeli]